MSKERILQVAYTESLLETRRLLLERKGYLVLSALGNEAAMTLAGSSDYDIAVVGNCAEPGVRSRMIRWMKCRTPGIPVIALCSGLERFPEADGQIVTDDPETWLALLGRCRIA